ncbi:MAG: hypothetical protein M9894_32990 [Planctomycetes bacterium]|nr:hypothetical protein [Planctomycetota bacterium]
MPELWIPAGAARERELGAGRTPDLAPFVRANLGALTGGLGPVSRALEGWVLGQTAKSMDPRLVPLSALRAMGSHPVVYLAERTITGIVRRPNLYFVRHADKRVVKETEEWLWPLLPDLLACAARAYVYGAIPVVLDWGRRDLRIEVPREQGGVRNKRLPGHTHYVRAHEVWPGDAELEVDDEGALAALRVDGRRYAANRAHVFVWDREFGSWAGQGARRRAWQSYVESLGTRLLYALYLERSVDSPRLVYAPAGTTQIDGRDVQITEYMGQLSAALRGSGTLALPSVRDVNGHRRYELETLDIPDRKDVWQQALNYHDAGILMAYLVPPRLAGLDDLAATGAKVLDGALKEFIQDFAQFAAENLTHLVRAVHAVNHDPDQVPAPEVLAYEIPASARKLYLEVLRLVSAARLEQPPAAWVDVPGLLDQLGVPLRTSPAATEAGAQTNQVGRSRDATGGREERREDARTVEGEDAVGARGEAQDEGGVP